MTSGQKVTVVIYRSSPGVFYLVLCFQRAETQLTQTQAWLLPRPPRMFFLKVLYLKRRKSQRWLRAERS